MGTVRIEPQQWPLAHCANLGNKEPSPQITGNKVCESRVNKVVSGVCVCIWVCMRLVVLNESTLNRSGQSEGAGKQPSKDGICSGNRHASGIRLGEDDMLVGCLGGVGKLGECPSRRMMSSQIGQRLCGCDDAD